MFTFRNIAIFILINLVGIANITELVHANHVT